MAKKRSTPAAKADEKVRAKRGSVKQTGMDAAIEDLPATSHPGVELAWVRGHPKMDRASDGKTVSINRLADIEDAPSRAAVSSLRYWVNHVPEFHKNMMMEHRKSSADTEAAKEASEGPPEIARIDEMLALLEGAVKHD